MRKTPSQLCLFGGSHVCAGDPDDFEYDLPEPLTPHLTPKVTNTLFALKCRIAGECQERNFPRWLTRALVQSFARSLIGPTQRRLLDPLDLKKQVAEAVTWCNRRNKHTEIQFVAPDAVADVLSNGYIPIVRAGKVGEYLIHHYFKHGKDPFEMDELAINVSAVVEESVWESQLRQTVAELCFAGCLMFSWSIAYWSRAMMGEPYPAASSACKWLALFDLLGDGVVPLALDPTNQSASSAYFAQTLFVVSPVLTS